MIADKHAAVAMETHAPVVVEPPVEPLKILHVIDTLEYGGAERSLLEIVSRLDRAKVRPVVCHVYEGAALAAQFEAADVPVETLGVQAKYGFVTAVRRLTEMVRRERPDLIHTSLFRAGQIGRIAGWRTETPVVSSWTNTPYSRARRRWDPAGQSLRLQGLRLMDMLTARLVRRFHSVSTAVADDNCRHLRVSAERVSMVPRGRYLSPFDAVTSDDIAQLRQELALTERRPVLLNVGRLVPQKGQKSLIEMVSHLRDSLPTALMMIAGDGPLRGELKKTISDSGLENHVSLLGTRRDVPVLLKACDVFVFPSHYEGLPGALVEAMLAGVPVIASDIPMHREFLEHDETGLLVDPASPRQLSEAVSRLVGEPKAAQRMAKAAKESARSLFEINHVARQMEDLFVACTKRKGNSL